MQYPGSGSPSAAPEPRYTSRCGLGEPELLAIQEGISVGYGDDYTANLEGQYLRLTGLRAGRYVLVHTVNAKHRLRELDYSNNSSSRPPAAALATPTREQAASPGMRGHGALRRPVTPCSGPPIRPRRWSLSRPHPVRRTVTA